MKIAFISFGTLPLPPVKGGAVENLIDTFIKENEKTSEHQIEIFSIYSAEAKEQSSQYKCCRYNYINLESFLRKSKKAVRHAINILPNTYVGNEFIFQVKKLLLKDCDYDVVVVENKVEYGLTLRSVVRTKLVLHLHNDHLNVNTKLSANILKCYNEIYAISDFISNRVRSIGTSTMVNTLYNGIDTKRFDREGYLNEINKIRKRYKINDNDIVFIYSGRLTPDKGVKELITAFVSLPENLNAKLLIVGSTAFSGAGSSRFVRELHKIAKTRETDIIFTGYINYIDMPRMYAMADIGVVPSIGTDAATLTTPEIMSTGLPVIISDSGGIKELVNKYCGIVVFRGDKFIWNLRDSMLKLATNSKLRLAMGIAGRKKALEYDTSKYYNEFCKLLEKSI